MNTERNILISIESIVEINSQVEYRKLIERAVDKGITKLMTILATANSSNKIES